MVCPTVGSNLQQGLFYLFEGYFLKVRFSNIPLLLLPTTIIPKKTAMKSRVNRVWARHAGLLAHRAECSDPRAAGETQDHMGSGFPSKQLAKQSHPPSIDAHRPRNIQDTLNTLNTWLYPCESVKCVNTYACTAHRSEQINHVHLTHLV